MNALVSKINPEDPAEIGYPPTLPVEVALRVAPIQEICAQYGLTRQDWDVIRYDPVFVADLQRAVEMVHKEGMSFKVKAQLQSEMLLQKSWRMIHDENGEVPPAVQADLIKFTIRAAGLDGSKDQAAANTPQNALQININLG